ncbi:MAG: PAS domain S-box protein [Patescibacteria group bacterium]
MSNDAKSQFISIIKRWTPILSGAGAIFLLYFADSRNYNFLYFFIQFLAIAVVINYFLKIWSSANYFNKPLHSLGRDLNQSQERYESAEKIIQDARVYAESIVNTVRDPLVVLDENLKIVSANWAFYYTFRFLREKSEGRLFYEIYNNYWDIPALKENLEKAVKNNIPINNLEISHNFPKIGRRILIFNARRIYQANERNPRFLLSIRDFTEKKRSEEQLRQSEEKYRNIFDNASDAIITIDFEDNITSWNKSAETMFGWRSDEIIGKKFGALAVPKNFYAERGCILKNVFSGKNLTGIETVRVKKDKSKINVSITTSPIFNEKREIVGLSAIIRDITKQKEIDKAKTEFVSVASHELRTPLANMSLSVEMILDSIAGPLNPEQKKYLRGIYRDIKGMSELVDALLNVSRIELRTMVVAPEPASLYEIMENVLKEITPQINKKDLKVKKIFDPALPVINIDRNLMRIILQNLLSNAIKYTPSAGKIGIEVKKEKNNALIKVSDNGCGIPKDQRGKIFQKLFRAKNAIDQRIEGVGLGLYIVKSIVIHCGGKIWVESEENKGTAFYVKIPLAGMKKRG